MTPQQLKKALISAGFEVFRTLSDEVAIAERVRENLILDSGVRFRAGSEPGTPMQVRVVLRVSRGDFPNETETALFDRVVRHAASALEAGYVELSRAVTHVKDPGDGERTLDTYFEILFAKDVTTLDDGFAEVRFALALDRTGTP